jgi:cytochrome P450
VFQVLTHQGPKIILPLRYLSEVQSDRRFSLDIPNNDDFFVQWPAFSPQSGFTHESILKDTINRKLTPSLTRITRPVSEENEFAIKELFPHSDTWQSTPLADKLIQLTTKTSCRIFLGLPLCRDPKALRVMQDWSVELVEGSQVMMRWPLILRPVVYLVHPTIRKLATTVATARAIFEPEIRRCQALLEERGNSGDDEKQRSLTAIQWLIETSNEAGKQFDVLSGLLSLAFGAIHTSSHTLTQVLYDIMDNPELIPELRQEIISVVQENNGWEKQSLYKLKLLDSVMKESIRLRPIRLSEWYENPNPVDRLTGTLTQVCYVALRWKMFS